MNRKHKLELGITILVLIGLTLLITIGEPTITGRITGTTTTETITINQTTTGNHTIEQNLTRITSLRVTGETTGETRIR